MQRLAFCRWQLHLLISIPFGAKGGPTVPWIGKTCDGSSPDDHLVSCRARFSIRSGPWSCSLEYDELAHEVRGRFLPPHLRKSCQKSCSAWRTDMWRMGSHAAPVIICLFNLALASWSAWRVAPPGLTVELLNCHPMHPRHPSESLVSYMSAFNT